jgi:hypothetical protein
VGPGAEQGVLGLESWSDRALPCSQAHLESQTAVVDSICFGHWEALGKLSRRQRA